MKPQGKQGHYYLQHRFVGTALRPFETSLPEAAQDVCCVHSKAYVHNVVQKSTMPCAALVVADTGAQFCDSWNQSFYVQRHVYVKHGFGELSRLTYFCFDMMHVDRRKIMTKLRLSVSFFISDAIC